MDTSRATPLSLFCDGLDTKETRRLLDFSMNVTTDLTRADREHLQWLIFEIILHKTPPPEMDVSKIPGTPPNEENDSLESDELHSVSLELSEGFVKYFSGPRDWCLKPTD